MRRSLGAVLLALPLAGCVTHLAYGGAVTVGDLRLGLERRQRDLWSSDAGARGEGQRPASGVTGREVYGLLRLDCGGGRIVEEEIRPIDFALGGTRTVDCGPRQVVVHRLLGSGVDLEVRR